MSEYLSESGHWYKKDGSPAYTVIGNNGKERPTTVRDARKLDLLPSVTSIIRQAAAPGLEIWKQNQVLLAALTLPREKGETEQQWLARVMLDSKEQARKAADLGKDIHAAIDLYALGKPYPAQHAVHVTAAYKKLDEVYGPQGWRAQVSFATPRYGGMADLVGDSVLIDVKTKEFSEGDGKKLAWDEHIMQLAAYRIGIYSGGPKYLPVANLFVSTNNPGLVVLHEWTEEEAGRGGQMFGALLDYWWAKNWSER